MEKMTLLITGSKGLLGTELKKHIKEAIWLDIDEMNICDKDAVKTTFKKYRPDVVLHLAAYTDVAAAEYKVVECYKTNVEATLELAKRSPMFIYMSTEYVFDGEKGNYHEGAVPNPVNFYSLTKLLGEFEAKKARRYSIIRTLFKPRPFEHEYVATDMWTSGDYVDVIAKKIALAVENVRTLPTIVNIGTDKKNLFEMAKETRPDVKPIKRISLPIRLPRDTSLDTTLWRMLRYEE